MSSLKPHFRVILYKSPRIRARVVCLILLALTCFANTRSTAAHEFEDGHIERSASCVIRDQELVVEYSIGMNPLTMKLLMAQWESDRAAAEAKREAIKKKTGESDEPNGLRGLNPDKNRPQGNEAEKVTPKHVVQPDSNPNLKPDSPRDETADDPKSNSQTETSTETETEKKTESVTRLESGSGPESESDSDSDSESKTAPELTPEQIELRKEFETAALAHLKRQLKVQMDGNALLATSCMASQTARHHVDLVITMKFDLSRTITLQHETDSPSGARAAHSLSLVDQAFDGNVGDARYSLKAKGIAMLTQSNVAPILVRAKRISLDGLTTKERLERCQIQARFGFVEIP